MVFQLCQFVSIELAPAVVAASKILAGYTANSWGELHPALREHADTDFIKDTFSIDGIKGLTKLRANYVTEAVMLALQGRTAMASATLRELVQKHESIIHQMDACCGIGAVDTDQLTSAYGTAFTSLLQKQTFTIQEVTEDTSSKSEQNTSTATTAEASTTSAATSRPRSQTTQQPSSASSASRVLSLASISCLSADNTQSQHDANADVDIFPTTESLHAFRLHLAADMMLKSRQTVLTSCVAVATNSVTTDK